jgi:hypothetical protein
MRHHFNIACILLVLLFRTTAFSQVQKYTLNGHLRAAKTGEEIIGGIVVVKGQTIGANTNAYGYYSLTLPQGTYTIIYRFLGFEDIEKEVTLDKNVILNIELEDKKYKLQTVEITETKQKETVQEKRIGVTTMDMKTVQSMPALMGEVDVLKTIQLMPGIQSAGEGNSGFNVRGGGSDQNLILLDEATVYNASHLLGFFSVFNSDAIKDIDVYKGGIPAKYGGRLASLLDVRMKDGNSKRFSASGGLGIISSRLTLEGPLPKEKGSFIISGRRTYGDLFLKFTPEEKGLRDNALYFYDFNLKGNYRLNAKNRIYLSGYYGRDVLNLAHLVGINWGNATQTLRWNHLFNTRLFSNITAIYSNFNYGIEIDFSESQNFKIASAIRDYGLKADLSYFINPKNSLYFGGSSVFHQFSPGEFSPLRSSSIIKNQALPEKYALENALYLEHELKFSEVLKVRYGLRYAFFNVYGSATDYTYQADNSTIKDTLKFAPGQLIKSYGGFEPRVAFSYSLNEFNALKLSYDRTQQFLHQASNTASTLPIDQWIPSGLYIKPQISDQVALGYFKEIKAGYEASVETYYKSMQNQIDYKDNAMLIFNNRVDRQLLTGKGWSYGAEFLVKKNKGNTTGWISYTLSKTLRQIDGINDGNPYYPVNDRRHNLSLVLSYRFKERFILAGTWVYYTGKPASFPRGAYEYDGNQVKFYTERNGYRLPDYHRMDISLTIEGKKKEGKRFESSWNFSIFNVYNRANTTSIIFRQKKDANGYPTSQTEAVSISLFKLVPSVTWNFKF